METAELVLPWWPPQPDIIYVTGSTRTGRLIMEAAAKTMTPVISELGGKDPMLVLDDADVAAAARWGVWGFVLQHGANVHGGGAGLCG